MFVAVVIASIPQLQRAFFTPGTFIQNSVTRAVSQTGNVAVPLILVVLGANLAGNTHPKVNSSDKRHETKILVAALISRMVLPFIFVAPLLAVAAKFLNVSILDDPIFVIVCFLLAGAPSALQLAQICQLNGVYESVMAKILFWSYVVVILPSTLIQVITAIEVVEWAM
jgi:predicted permease